jgi:hypothetical protein
MLRANRTTIDDGDYATGASGLHRRFRSERTAGMDAEHFDHLVIAFGRRIPRLYDGC